MSHLVCNLSISLQEKHCKKESYKGQEAKQPDVVLPPLGLLAVPTKRHKCLTAVSIHVLTQKHCSAKASSVIDCIEQAAVQL